MNAIFRALVLLGFLSGMARSAEAGWVIEWTNIASGRNREQRSVEPSTMYVAGDRVRVEQPRTVAITDYRNSRLTFLDPERELFWTGTVDEYLAAMRKERETELDKRFGEGTGEMKVDLTRLPEIEIEATEEQKDVAGYSARRHEIRSAGEPFQELWLAADLDLSKDLDPGRFLSLQAKMAAAMLGKSAAAYSALYRTEGYRKLIESGFPLEVKTAHIAGFFDRTATSVRAASVEEAKFGVPEDYRRVRLRDVFPSAE